MEHPPGVDGQSVHLAGPYARMVAQIVNLLDRRLLIAKGTERLTLRPACGLPIRATADGRDGKLPSVRPQLSLRMFTIKAMFT